MVRSFFPTTDGTAHIDATGTSANVKVAVGSTGPIQVRLYNAGTDPVFIRPGSDSTVVATTSDMPVAPGSVEVITLDIPEGGSLWIAAITASGATIYFTVGAGI